MRTRKISLPTTDSSRCIRFTTLTCLLCQTAAYRVQQLVVPDVDLQEGPLLPSSEWVEQEILLSSCGWIQVHNDCLVSDSAGSRLSRTNRPVRCKRLLCAFIRPFGRFTAGILLCPQIQRVLRARSTSISVMLTCHRFSLPRTLRDCHPLLRIRLSLASLYLRMRCQRQLRHNQPMRVLKNLLPR